MTKADDQRHLREMIEQLDETHREVLRLIVLDGIPKVRVAEMLGIGEEALRKRVERARTALLSRAATWRAHEDGQKEREEP